MNKWLWRLSIIFLCFIVVLGLSTHEERPILTPMACLFVLAGMAWRSKRG